MPCSNGFRASLRERTTAQGPRPSISTAHGQAASRCRTAGAQERSGSTAADLLKVLALATSVHSRAAIVAILTHGEPSEKKKARPTCASKSERGGDASFSSRSGRSLAHLARRATSPNRAAAQSTHWVRHRCSAGPDERTPVRTGSFAPTASRGRFRRSRTARSTKARAPTLSTKPSGYIGRCEERRIAAWGRNGHNKTENRTPRTPTPPKARAEKQSRALHLLARLALDAGNR